MSKLQWFEESLLEVRKVTKVTTGWRRMRFRATVLVGDRGWNIGIGVWKGTDVAIAVSKATHNAYKNITQVSITKSGSVPYQVNCKYKSCLVMLRPAWSGTWLKAGSSVRIVLELAWYTNILSKIIGSNNSLNNALAVIDTLTRFKVNADHIQTTKEIVKATAEEKDAKKYDKPRRDNKERKPVPRKTEDAVAPVSNESAPVVKAKAVKSDAPVKAKTTKSAPKKKAE